MATTTSGQSTPRTIYHARRIQQKRRRSVRRVITVAIIIILALIAFAALEILRAPNVSAMSPAPGGYVAKSHVTVRFTVKGYSGLKNVVVRLDGQDVTASVHATGDRLSFVSGPLADGAHSASFSADSGNIFRSHLNKVVRFTVDTAVPHVDLGTLEAKPVVTSVPAMFTGVTEPLARVTVSDRAVTASTTADSTGAYTLTADLPEGYDRVTFTVRDRAGNHSQQRVKLFVDGTPPQLTVAPIATPLFKDDLTLAVSASDTAATPTVAAKLNGIWVKVAGTVSDGKIRLRGLAQGICTLVVTATDKGGHVTTSRQRFLVNSTENFGYATMMAGARGKDVVALQKSLTHLWAYKGKLNGVYDQYTVAAVKKLQKRYGMAVDGIVGQHMLVALSGRIVVSLSRLRLYLYRGDKLVKSYPVATGQPAWPTPTGTYSIISMKKDPTWLPPNSDWAKNATPIAPGTDNPLGTRWMGTSAPGVGMHGVPPDEDGTIGTYASHGCIRMHNWDAIDLFDRVAIGMPVIIQQ